MGAAGHVKHSFSLPIWAKSGLVGREERKNCPLFMLILLFLPITALMSGRQREREREIDREGMF